MTLLSQLVPKKIYRWMIYWEREFLVYKLLDPIRSTANFSITVHNLQGEVCLWSLLGLNTNCRPACLCCTLMNNCWTGFESYTFDFFSLSFLYIPIKSINNVNEICATQPMIRGAERTSVSKSGPLVTSKQKLHATQNYGTKKQLCHRPCW